MRISKRKQSTSMGKRGKGRCFVFMLLFTGFTVLTAGCGSEKQSAEKETAEKITAEEALHNTESDGGEDVQELDEDIEGAEDFEEAEDGGEDSLSEEFGEITSEAILMLSDASDDFFAELQEDPDRVKETTTVSTEVEISEEESVSMDVCTIELDGKKMQYSIELVGEPDDDGLYPLYITMHGGGDSDAWSNNEQWYSMSGYYLDSVESGIYVAVRGMEDAWNMHFLDAAFPMYDRLIEDMICFYNADPNRVYLLGYSAGGDGVYGVAPRMADRFAAVSMSSGHPNGVSLLNTSNLPFEIEVGIRDLYTDTALRSIRGAEYEDVLNSYEEEYGCEYPHRILVHVPNGHFLDDCSGGDEMIAVLKDPSEFASRAIEESWPDQFLELYVSMGGEDDLMDMSYEYVEGFDEKLFELVTGDLGMEVDTETDTDAIHYVDAYVREPMPERFVFDLSTRAAKRKDSAFYWLKADHALSSGVIIASYEEETNTVTLETDGNVNGEVTILANPYLMDFDRPLTVITPGGEQTIELQPREDIARDSVRETGDFFLSWADEITVQL